MTSLTVEPEAGETTIFGKTVNTLQTGVSVDGNAITGTLTYVSDYTDFNSDPTYQKGNFLALKFTNGTVGSVLNVELVGGVKDAVKFEDDTKAVILITDKAKQKIKVTISKDGDAASKIYNLNGLTLQSAG